MVDEGLVFYYETRQRVRVSMTDVLVQQTLDALAAARRVAEAGAIPPPLVDSPKCPRCSLVTICLPDETLAAVGVMADDVDQPDLFGRDDTARREHNTGDEVRRLVPARDDLRPLYVTGFGLSVHKSGGVLQIKDKGKVVQEARLNDLNQVNLFGPVTISGAVVHALCSAEIPIAHFSISGWFNGLTTGLGLTNVFLRRAQFRRADDDGFCLHLARSIVATKIRNQRTLLQRNHVEPPAQALDALKRMARRAEEAGSLEALLGIEGSAAATYSRISRE